MYRAFYNLIILLIFSSLSLSSYAAPILNLNKDEAKTIQLDVDMSSVFISNPNIADYSTIGKKTLVVYGKSVGSASLIIFDSDGKTVYSRTVTVNTNLLSLKQYVSAQFPDLSIEISHIGDHIVLEGLVATEQQKMDVEALVGEILGKSFNELTVTLEGRGKPFHKEKTYQGILNNLKVAVTKQVNVKLTVAEVSQSFVENLGVRLFSDGEGFGTITNSIVGFSASDIVAIINAVQDNSVGQVLAEPNISVISGESASFLVGGELPLVTVIDGTTTVTYKEYGIKLDLAANVLKDDKIRLAILPEVSSLDSQYRNETYDLPALKTRKASTVVELGDGQSFVLAGLLNNEEVESFSKIPFIADVPILGALFRYSQTERKKTELVIVATVSLVKPIESRDVRLPVFRQTTTLERLFDFSQEGEDQQETQEWLEEGGFIQ